MVGSCAASFWTAWTSCSCARTWAGSTSASSVGATAGLSQNGVAATSSVNKDVDSDDDKRRKRQARRNLLLDFLGFGAEK